MTDNVNHPSHYAEGWSNGAEVIDITENLNFNRGNAVKYAARAGRKDPASELEDLKKARWYLDREIRRLGDNPEPEPTQRTAWTLESVQEELGKLWGYRATSQREWALLDFVPPGVIVEDQDGDFYRRINGTGHFEISAREHTYGQHYEWQNLWPGLYRDQHNYGPFKEVTDG